MARAKENTKAKNLRKSKDKLRRYIVIRLHVSKNYLTPNIAAHCIDTYKNLGIDVLKTKPADLLQHMGIKPHRFYKLIHDNADVTLAEAVAYFDYMKERGSIENFEQLFTRV